MSGKVTGTSQCFTVFIGDNENVKLENHVANLYDNKEYIVHTRVLKANIHKVIKLKQKA